MQPTTTDALPVCLILNRRKLDEILRGSQSQADIARMIGVTPSTLWRLSTGKTTPSNQVIARIVRAFPGVPFHELFLVCEEGRNADA